MKVAAALWFSLAFAACTEAQVEMLDHSAAVESAAKLSAALSGRVVLGTLAEVRARYPRVKLPAALPPESFAIRQAKGIQVVAGADARGILYGTFALIRATQLHAVVPQEETPYAPIRWVNEWDNLDGSIERGYGGRSIFFANGTVLPDLTRASAYAQLLASVGINGCTINNVNADTRVLSPEFLHEAARIADVFRPWGVKLSLAVDFASPQKLGGLPTFDPLDPQVRDWWKKKADEIYRVIPDFAGFVLKADSEGRLGPSVYHRSHADAANLLARALAPHGGILVYRAFVYNHHMDWRDLKNDRARAAYDNFKPLDGAFDNNVVLQIKYGPIDFQAREPVSPLIGALKSTNEALELQITQEYTGQQRHLCFLAPMWNEVLNFSFGPDATVKQLVSGKTHHRPLGGFVGVSNVGDSVNGYGSDLAPANLYSFGRLAWNPNLNAEHIAQEWTRLKWGDNPIVNRTINDLLLRSWKTYEGYTGPLGLGTLTDILHGHYGPGIETAEHNGWGQWIRADHEGIGMDRTVATGTGFIGQYPPDVARIYESLATTPDNLLLFFHHVPYTYRLHSGKTVIQHIYDSHYEAAAEAQKFPEQWAALKGLVDNARYERVLAQLTYQSGHAIVWRDAICNWFLRESGIADAQGRVGHYPDRIEAENMTLDGYEVADVSPWETASNGKAVICQRASCSAKFVFHGKAGNYDLAVGYFDLPGGTASFHLYVNDREIGSWNAPLTFPTKQPDGDTATRQTIQNVELKSGDRIRIEGAPDGPDSAPLDYVAVDPH